MPDPTEARRSHPLARTLDGISKENWLDGRRDDWKRNQLRRHFQDEGAQKQALGLPASLDHVLGHSGSHGGSLNGRRRWSDPSLLASKAVERRSLEETRALHKKELGSQLMLLRRLQAQERAIAIARIQNLGGPACLEDVLRDPGRGTSARARPVTAPGATEARPAATFVAACAATGARTAAVALAWRTADAPTASVAVAAKAWRTAAPPMVRVSSASAIGGCPASKQHDGAACAIRSPRSVCSTLSDVTYAPSAETRQVAPKMERPPGLHARGRPCMV